MLRHMSILVVVLGTSCNYSGDKKPSPPDTVPAPAPLIQQLLDAHNAERARAGVAPLKLDDRLVRAAQKHADWMAANRVLSHTGANGSSFVDRIRASGYPMLAGGENIAAGHPDVRRVMAGWKSSPGHYRNIINGKFSDVGFGVKGRYWCTVLASPARGNNPSFIVEEQPGGIEYKER